VDSATVAFGLRGFTGKEERLFHWLRQRLAGPKHIHASVAVRTSEKWIGMPVMEIDCVRPRHLPIEDPLQRFQSGAGNGRAAGFQKLASC
jgi:hypothetical protein